MSISHFKFDNIRSFETHQSKLDATKPYIVLVYANWCGFCKSMRSAWDTSVTSVSTKVPIVEVESEVLKHILSQRMNSIFAQALKKVTDGYPTISVIEPKSSNSFDTYPYPSRFGRTPTEFSMFFKTINDTYKPMPKPTLMPVRTLVKTVKSDVPVKTVKPLPVKTAVPVKTAQQISIRKYLLEKEKKKKKKEKSS